MAQVKAQEMVPVQCPGCGTEFQVPPKLADRELRCPNCAGPVTARRFHRHAPQPSLAAEPVDDRAGDLIGDYRVVSLIATGGTGTMYEAHDERGNRPVALRVIKVAEVAND